MRPVPMITIRRASVCRGTGEARCWIRTSDIRSADISDSMFFVGDRVPFHVSQPPNNVWSSTTVRYCFWVPMAAASRFASSALGCDLAKMRIGGAARFSRPAADFSPLSGPFIERDSFSCCRLAPCFVFFGMTLPALLDRTTPPQRCSSLLSGFPESWVELSREPGSDDSGSRRPPSPPIWLI